MRARAPIHICAALNAGCRPNKLTDLVILLAWAINDWNLISDYYLYDVIFTDHNVNYGNSQI